MECFALPAHGMLLSFILRAFSTDVREYEHNCRWRGAFSEKRIITGKIARRLDLVPQAPKSVSQSSTFCLSISLSFLSFHSVLLMNIWILAYWNLCIYQYFCKYLLALCLRQSISSRWDRYRFAQALSLTCFLWRYFEVSIQPIFSESAAP